MENLAYAAKGEHDAWSSLYRGFGTIATIGACRRAEAELKREKAEGPCGDSKLNPYIQRLAFGVSSRANQWQPESLYIFFTKR